TVAVVELTWVTMAGSGRTPEALRARSCAPQLKLQESSAMWYGEPLIAEAEWPWPQSIDDAMRPPHARAGFRVFAVNWIVIVLLVLALVGAQPDRPYAETLVMVPPHMVKTPAICEPVKAQMLARVGSAGIAPMVLGLPRTHPDTPSHGSALVTVRFQ